MDSPCQDEQRRPEGWPQCARGHIPTMTLLSPRIRGPSPGRITVLVPRLTLAPLTTTRRQSKARPPPLTLWGLSLGSRKKETSTRTLEQLPQQLRPHFPLPSALPQVYHIPKPREASRTRWYQSFPSKRNSYLQSLKCFYFLCRTTRGKLLRECHIAMPKSQGHRPLLV